MNTAVIMKNYGDPQVLEYAQVPLRNLQQGEVLIKVTASAVNRADLEIRSGKWSIQSQQPFPYIPGIETCGIIANVGPGTDLEVGTSVITMMQKMAGIHGLREGGYQRFVIAPADTLAVVPDHINLTVLAAVGLAGVTAFHGIRKLNLSAGDRVIIQGVSGGVGSIAALLANHLGCYVIGVTHRSKNIEDIRQLGVSEIWDTSETSLLDWCEEKVDAVLEMVGGQVFADSVSCLKRGGRLCSVGALTGGDAHLSVWNLLHDLELSGWSSENMEQADLQSAIDALCSLIKKKALRAPPYTTYNLAQAAQAHHDIEEGKVFGRVLLVP